MVYLDHLEVLDKEHNSTNGVSYQVFITSMGVILRIYINVIGFIFIFVMALLNQLSSLKMLTNHQEIDLIKLKMM